MQIPRDNHSDAARQLETRRRIEQEDNELRAAVDAGGWNAVRMNARLNAIWQQRQAESRQYVDSIDR